MGAGANLVIIALAVGAFFAIGGVAGLRDVGANLKDAAGGLFPELPEAAAETSGGGGASAQVDDQPIQTGVVAQRKNVGLLQSTVRITDIQPELQREVARSVSGGAQIVRGGTILFDQPTEKLRRTLTGKGTAQFSTGQVGILTEQRRAELRSKGFTLQEQQDIIALEERRRRAIERGVRPNVKLSGVELVLRKREQEELSKSILTQQFGTGAFVGGKLFANPDFSSCNLAGKCFD